MVKGENFHELLAFAVPTNAMPAEITSQTATKLRNSRNFSPLKVSHDMVYSPGYDVFVFIRKVPGGFYRPPIWKRYKIAVRIGPLNIHRLAIQDGYYVCTQLS